jgi:hypothetical protein
MRTSSGEIEGLRPGRGASRSNPAMPCRRKRERYRAAVRGTMEIDRAISMSCLPAAASHTMRARRTTRAGVLRPRAL